MAATAGCAVDVSGAFWPFVRVMCSPAASLEDVAATAEYAELSDAVDSGRPLLMPRAALLELVEGEGGGAGCSRVPADLVFADVNGLFHGVERELEAHGCARSAALVRRCVARMRGAVAAGEAAEALAEGVRGGMRLGCGAG